MVLASTPYSGILVVDDDEIMLRSMLRLLARHGAEGALGGVAALDRLRARRFALVICDLRMPDLDGPSLYTTLLGEDPEQAARFVFVTGGAAEDRYEAFLSRVSNPTLEKPFVAEALWDLVKQYELTDPDPQP